MSFINPYPITKKGIQDHNPEINAIYTGKTGKSPHFYSVGPKTSGSAMGAIFQKRHFDPSKAAPCKKWMGKANTPIHRNNLPRPTGERLLSEGEVKRYQEAMNISAIYEKIAYDCFYEMGRGIFRVPKTRLSREKFSTPHMREHFLAHVLSDSGIQESLFIMSQIDENYQDFSQAQVEKGLTFIQYLEKYHCPPDHLLTPQGKKVPIKGFMGVLGVGRVLADTDTLGSSGTNAGFQWVYQNGAITYAQTVKIDPGESFSFSLYDHEEALTKNRVLTTLDRPTLEGSPASDLKDIRDLQYGNMISGEKAIQWSTLEENQKDEFLSVLFNASRYLNEDKILQFLLERDEKFNRSPLEQIPKKLTTSIKTKMQSWIRLQLNIYKEDLNLFKSRHPEKILKAYYIDSLGELPLPASQETFPIEELFTQLTLINTESQKGENQPLRKDLPEQDSLTEAFKRGKITSEPINLEDLFIPKEGKPCNKVLMIGGAGIGKSTVCQKIAYDWAAGRLWNTQFKYIYWLPLRYLNPLVKEGKLNRKDPDEWLAQAASHLILKDPALYLSMLREIKAHKHQMLILFDGYDEATPALAQALSPFETSTDLKILFTSRPGPITSLQEKMDRLVENIGFSDPQIHSYMNHYFARKLEIHDPIKAKEALKASLPPSFDLAKEIDNVSLFLISEDQDLRKEALYILGTLGAYAAALNEQDLKNHIVEMLQHKKEKEATLSLNHIARYETDYSPPQRHINPNDLLEIFNKDPNLQAISHTPLQLQMLCALWEQGARECSFPKNLTGLYTTMLTHLFHWNQKEQQKIQYHSLHPEDKHQAFLTLGKAALIGLQEGNLMVSHETLTKSFSADEIQALLTTRLLQGVKKQDAAAYVDYAFLHLTFQEYLAAYFMSCQTRETQKDWIVKHRYFPQFQLVMAFLGGLIHAKDNSDKTRTKAFIEDLHAPPIELIGIAQMHVTLRVLEECRDETLQSWAEERFHIYQAYGDYVLFNIEKLNEAQVTFQFPSFIWPSFMGKINALLKGSDRRVRSSACEALVKLGEKGDKEQFSKILEALRPRLKDSNKRVRRSACDVLVKLGEKGDKEQFSKILEALRPRLKDSNKRVRSSACDVLVKLGEKGDKEQFSKLLKALLPLLQDAYFYVRRSACYALGKLVEKGDEGHLSKILEALLPRLKDSDSSVRSSACYALGRLGKKGDKEQLSQLLEALRPRLKDSNKWVRSSAYEALVQLVEKGDKEQFSKILEALLPRLQDADSYVQSSACEALVQLGENIDKEQFSKILEALLPMIQDADSDVRRLACYALVKLGEKGGKGQRSQLLEALLPMIQDADSYVRRSACYALGKLVKKGDEGQRSKILEALLPRLQDSEGWVRRSACDALVKLVEKGNKGQRSQLLEALLPMIQDSEGWVRSSACEALVQLGENIDKEKFSKISGALLPMIQDANSSVRSSACEALGKLVEKGDKEQFPKILEALLSVLQDANSSVQSSACEALVKLVEKGDEGQRSKILEALLPMIQDADSYVQSSACEALGKLGEKGDKEQFSELLEALLPRLQDSDFYVRRSACEALVKLVEKGDEGQRSKILEALLPMIQDADSYVRRLACYALVKLVEKGDEGQRSKILEALRPLLQDSEGWVRSSACYALVKLAEKGDKGHRSKILEALLPRLQDSDSGVRSSACKALVKLVEKGDEGQRSKILEALCPLLQDADSDVQRSACKALRELRERSKEQLPGILFALSKGQIENSFVYMYLNESILWGCDSNLKFSLLKNNKILESKTCGKEEYEKIKSYLLGTTSPLSSYILSTGHFSDTSQLYLV